MSLVAKALWYIENNYARPGLTLDDVAAACDASRFHLTRAFGLATGHSLIRYGRPELERYDERFDASSGSGGVEIWVPVALS